MESKKNSFPHEEKHCLSPSSDLHQLLFQELFVGNYIELSHLLKMHITSFYDPHFLETLALLLKNKSATIRGLASWTLSQIGKTSPLPQKIYTAWEKSVFNDDLEYEFLGNSNTCRCHIKDFGNYGTENTPNNIGVAFAITQASNTVSMLARRDQLDEYYFVISGNAEIWLKEQEAVAGKVTKLQQGSYFFIPKTAEVQFRSTHKNNPLVLLVVTTPPYSVALEKYDSLEILLEKGFWDLKK